MNVQTQAAAAGAPGGGGRKPPGGGRGGKRGPKGLSHSTLMDLELSCSRPLRRREEKALQRLQ